MRERDRDRDTLRDRQRQEGRQADRQFHKDKSDLKIREETERL